MSVTSCGICHTPVMNDKGPIGDVVDAFIYKYGDLQYIELFHRQCAVRKGYKVDAEGHIEGLGPRGVNKLTEAAGNCVLCYWDKVVDKNKYPLCHYHQTHKGMTEDSVVVQHEMSDTAPAVSKLETFKEHTASVAKAYKIDLFQVDQDALARELYTARKLKELRVYVAMKNGTRIEMTFDDAEQLRREYLGNIRSLRAYVQKRW